MADAVTQQGPKGGFTPPFDQPKVRAAVERNAQVVLAQLQAWLPGLSPEDAQHFALQACMEQVVTFAPIVLGHGVPPNTVLEITITKPRSSLIHLSGQDEQAPTVVLVGAAHIGEWSRHLPEVVFGGVLGHSLAQNPFLRAALYASGFRILVRVAPIGEPEPELPPS